MKNKIDYRIYSKKIRKTLDINNLSIDLVAKIRKLDCYQSAKNIMIFYPMSFEVDLLDLMRDEKKFYFPRVQDNELLVCPYSNVFKKSKYNIMEPCSKAVDCGVLDLVIVPALMADSEGYRLGYGGGFYDRFLKKCGAVSIVALAKELLVVELPRDKYDVKVDMVITC